MERREGRAVLVMCALAAMLAVGLGAMAHLIHGRSVAVSIVGALAFAALLPTLVLVLSPFMKSGRWRVVMRWSPLPVLVFSVVAGLMFALSGFLALGEALWESLDWGMSFGLAYAVAFAVADRVRHRRS